MSTNSRINQNTLQEYGNEQTNFPDSVRKEINKNQGYLSYFFDKNGLSLDTKKLLGSLGLVVGTVLGINNAVADELDTQPSKELLDKCDGIDRQGVINPDKKDGEIKGIVEKTCQAKYKLAKGKEELAKGKEELAKGTGEYGKTKEEYSKMIQILALLDQNEARKYLLNEIKKVESLLLIEKDLIKRKILNDKLDILKKRLKELDKNVA